jgi:hypothetical protein
MLLAGFEAGGPFHGGTNAGEFGGELGEDALVHGEVFGKHAESVFAHFLAGEEFGQGLGEVEAKLDDAGGQRHPEIVVAEEQPAFRMTGLATGIEEPGGRAGGIHVQQLQELLFEVPEVAEGVLGDIEGAQADDGFQKREVRVGVERPFPEGHFEAGQQPTDVKRFTIERLGEVPERVHGRQCVDGGASAQAGRD